MTPNLFHESLADALRDCIIACGGFKAVGVTFWPEKTVEVAGRQLSDCLNDAKREKLSPEQVLLILKMARERGCHVGVEYILAQLGYAPPQPIEPRDEAAELQRQFIEATKAMGAIAARLDKLQPMLRSVG